ncbi:MAG: tetratricopeptide repeat protein [Gemmatimonadota bacterium]|nr:tetratricopeptide repeat protein [Gemmatimonadota bacterium]
MEPSAGQSDDVLDRARELARAGAWSDVVALLEPTAPFASGVGDVRVLYAEALMRMGRERDACEGLRHVIPALLAAGDAVNHRRALNLLGVGSFSVGDLEEATGALNAAVELAAEAGDLLLFARATNNLGAIANLRGAHETALGHYRLAVPAYQRLGQRRGLAESYHNIAITYRDIGQLEESDDYERRAMDYAAEGIAPRVAAMGLIGRAEVALRKGDPQLARGTAQRAALDLRQLEDPMNEADAHRLVGTAANAMGLFPDASAAFERALSIARERGHALVEAETLRDRAIGLSRRGARSEARVDAAAAISIFERLGATSEVEKLSGTVMGS